MLGTTGFTASSDSSFTSTGALLISKGTTGQQPGSPVTGMLRYNTTSNEFEGYSGSVAAWKSVGGSAISNDTTTATFEYPLFAAATSGTAQNVYTSNANLLYQPSTGELQAQVITANNGIVVNSAHACNANYVWAVTMDHQQAPSLSVRASQSQYHPAHAGSYFKEAICH